jgi:hypothetical protein
MKKVIFYLMIWGGLFSCERREIVIYPPDDLIPVDSFTPVLRDLMVLEAHIQGKYVQLHHYADIMLESADSLFADYGITADRFERSLMFYGQQQDLLDSMYTQIIDTLNLRMAKLPE